MEENQVGVIFKDITERREAEDRQTFLLELNEKLRPLTDPEEIQITAMPILGSHLEVNRAFYSEPFQDKDTLQSNTGYNDGVEKAPDEVNISAFEPEIIERFLNGETLVFNDTLQEQVLKEDQEKVADAMQVRAAITVPVIRNGILVAAIRIHQRTPRIWTAAEVSLVEEASRHTWAEVERARFGNALRESEQKFRDLVEASALATWETNPEGSVVSDSPSWRAFTGQSYEDWKGYGWLNALPSEDRDLVLEKWEKAVSAQQIFNAEFRVMGANGENRWTNVKAVPIKSLDGKVTKWAGMNLDIHEMKMTEEALIKARDEAEAASRAKEDFVSTMSHEIRTPLNAVIGLTNLLLDNNPRKDQEVNLNSLSFSAQSLLSLIDDILDFSKLEAGKGEIDENVFNLSSLILSLQQLYEPQAQNNGSSFSIHLDKEIPQHIETDQLKLSQILHNLVSNAVKFTSNGNIDLRIEVARREKDMLLLDFVVKDTGIGLILIPEKAAQPVKDFFNGFNDVILKMIDLIMLAAPYGVFALLAALVVESPSADLFSALALYAITVITGLILMLALYAGIVWISARKTPRFFYNAIAPAQLLGFSISSSAATLPVTMDCVENNLKVPREVASFVLPIGATINMDGTSLYQAVAAVFIAQAFGIDLSLGSQLMIIVTATLASIGSAAFPGAGMVMLVIVLAQAGIPEAGLALIFAVDRPLDMCRTVINVSGDAAVSVMIAKSVSRKEKANFNAT